jgi:acetylglutamate kinase
MTSYASEQINETERQLLFVIKIGGNVIDDEKSLHAFLKEFASIKERKILVHGGGKIATAIGDKLNIQSKYTEGRRITDDETIDLVTMVYGGLVNKKIVAALQSMQCNAIGLSGADANVMPAIKRPVKAIDYGWVGDVNSNMINSHIWQLFIDHNLVPVVAPLTHDQDGHMLNTNADTMAAVLSGALSHLYQVELIYCFEKDGVLADVDNNTSVMAEFDRQAYQTLKEGKKLFAGILPKIDNAFDALSNNVFRVVVGNSNQLSSLIKGAGGTKIIS